jgi:hypothetical protein
MTITINNTDYRVELDRTHRELILERQDGTLLSIPHGYNDLEQRVINSIHNGDGRDMSTLEIMEEKAEDFIFEKFHLAQLIEA